MQQPMEERIASLETSSERHDETIARLASVVENHDQLLEQVVHLLEEVVHDAANTRQLLDRLLANQEATAQLLEEVVHDAATTRRLWLRLAQRYGWLEDEQNGAQPDTSG